MTLENEITEWATRIMLLEEQLEIAKEQYARYSNMKEMTSIELLDNFDHYVEFELEYKMYDKVTGGDGRGAPSSVNVGGFVLSIKILDDVYLTPIRKEMIVLHVKELILSEDPSAQIDKVVFE